MPDIRSFFDGKKRKATPNKNEDEARKKRKLENEKRTPNPAQIAAAAATTPLHPPTATPKPTTDGPCAVPYKTPGVEAAKAFTRLEFPEEETKLSSDQLRDRYKSKFDPIADAGWKKGKKMPYLVLAELFTQLEATTKRLEKVDLLSKVLRSVIAICPEILCEVIYLSINEYAPTYEGLELGIGDQVIMKALAESTGRQMRDIKADYVKQGDLGIVAEASRSNQKTMFPPPPLTTKNVFDKLKKIAKTSGNKAQGEKVRIMMGLFVSAKGPECRFVTRHLQGKMRMGLAEQTVIAALGRALAFTPLAVEPAVMNQADHLSPEKMHALETRNTNILKQVISEMPNYETICQVLRQHGVEKLHHYCHLTPGIPIKAMLAKPTTGIQEILKRFANMKFTLEYKYDGERAQIHLLPNGHFKFFSRNAEDNSTKFPDLVATIKSFCKPDVKSFILDSEVVAYDRVKKQILPFQVLTHRKRKDAEAHEITIQVCIYAFDLLYLNGESLIRKPFGERRKMMYDSFIPTEGQFQFADHKDSANPEEIETYLAKSIEDQCEGLMVKTLWKEATYEPSRRSHNWLKCKKDYLEGCGDTLDLVVIGAFYGTGKRTGKYGSFLVACYDQDDDYYQSICKIGTGFKDEDLEAHYNSLSKIVKPKKPNNYMVTDNFKCDVWFDAVQVWEVKCADLTVSPAHQAAVGRVHESKGIALRFPRFMRIREDKAAEDATNSEQVAELYLNQANLGTGGGGGGGAPRR